MGFSAGTACGTYRPPQGFSLSGQRRSREDSGIAWNTPLTSWADGTVSEVQIENLIFELLLGVCQDCVLAPTLPNACMEWIPGQIAGLTGCQILISRIARMYFAEDSDIRFFSFFYFFIVH